MGWTQAHEPNPTRADLMRDLDGALHGSLTIRRALPAHVVWPQLLDEVRQLVADRDTLRNGLADLLTATNGAGS